MEAPTRAPGYDLFKLIVAIVLLILALILMWASPSQTSVSLLITPSAALLASPTAAPVSPTSSPPTATASAIAKISEPASTSPPPTETPFLPPSPTQTEVAEATATPPPPPTTTPLPEVTEATATPPPPPTATPLPEATATPTPGPHLVSACEAATSRSRLQAGANATIVRRLNFRSSAGIRDNWILTNLPGTPVKVVGGPQCLPYWTGAYIWWQIQLPDGRVGWSAEESLHGSFYFMEPR